MSFDSFFPTLSRYSLFGDEEQWALYSADRAEFNRGRGSRGSGGSEMIRRYYEMHIVSIQKVLLV